MAGTHSDARSTKVNLSAIGKPIQDVPTPTLVLDLGAARRNIAAMARRVEVLPASLRPHIKVHKCAELARMQIEAGAIGVTVATVPEAAAMVDAGVSDVLVATQVVSPPSIARLLEAASRARVTVAVDDAGNLQTLARAARAAGLELGVLVEMDVGLGRGGARTVGEVVELAQLAAGTVGTTFEGLMGYEGHCASEADERIRVEEAMRSMALLASAADDCRRAGLQVSTVSAGATGTFEVTGGAASVTEVQAGSYVFMDRFHEPVATGFEFALTVAATVIGRHEDLLVLDVGRKSVDVSLRPLEPMDPRATLAFIHEEHAGLLYEGPAPGVIGDRVSFVPGYAPTTVNLFGTYHVVEDDRVVDVWPVLARHGVP
jgi:D-serine deaminase-like pyridoxal phosphate-dependent protein